jgi:putative FmdB family regulatory protein
MPIYEYQCTKCKARSEEIQKVNDPPKKKCPKCGGLLNKLISAPAFQFKGSGFYITDYTRKSSPEKEDKPKEKPAAEKSGPAKPGTKPSSD